MTCCETFAKIWMSIACFLFTISGLTLAGFTVYAQVYLTKHLYDDSNLDIVIQPLQETQGLWWVFGAGLCLALLSIAVWVATCHHENKCSKVILAICATFVLVLIIAIGAAATAFILWTNGNAGTLGTTINDEILNTVGKDCCQVNGTIFAPKVKVCSNGTITAECYPSLCKTTGWLDGCTSNSNFENAFKSWIKANIQWVAIAALIVGLLDLFSFILLCVLVCKKSRDSNYYTNYHSSSGPYV